MVGDSNPVHDLEIRIEQLHSLVDKNDIKISQVVRGMEEDIAEIKEQQKSYVRKESFAFYERAFWIVAGALGSSIIGAIFYVITTSKSGG
jgi:uncharacterized protein YdaL